MVATSTSGTPYSAAMSPHSTAPDTEAAAALCKVKTATTCSPIASSASRLRRPSATQPMKAMRGRPPVGTRVRERRAGRWSTSADSTATTPDSIDILTNS